MKFIYGILHSQVVIKGVKDHLKEIRNTHVASSKSNWVSEQQITYGNMVTKISDCFETTNEGEVVKRLLSFTF